MGRLERGVEAAGALADGLRRRMYLFIRAQGRPVGREEAAESVGISTKLAAFHLDKLVEKGLLKAHYLRLGGRSGPGAGRPSKVYEPSPEEVSVSFPPRSYDLLGSIFLAALESEAPGESGRDAALRAAEQTGRELGEKVGSGPRSTMDKACRVLADSGYEPYLKDDRIALRNCPFHDLARRSPELVCGINHSFARGLLEGLRSTDIEAALEPTPGECCVKLQARAS